jgi:hypothetical protein
MPTINTGTNELSIETLSERQADVLSYVSAF